MLRGCRIAVVEDDQIMGDSLVQRLELEGANVIWLRHVARALGALRTPPRPIDAVICDIRLPDGTGEDLFTRLNETTIPPPFLFITGHGGVGQAVRLMRAGAVDYMTKPFDISVLLERLTNLLARTQQEEFPAILGTSPAARRVEAMAAEVARSDRPVLIVGHRGTGKKLLARRIHELSGLRPDTFASVNLARDENVFHSLFASGGKLDTLGDGTLYLHAIGFMPDHVQDALLERIDQGFPGRLIASCGIEPEELVKEGGLQSELAYRLDMVTIPIPPLSERTEDVVWLMSHMFAQMNERRTRPLDGISALTEEAVRSHSWPGGGRELRARMVRAMSIATGPILQPAELFPERVAEGAALQTLAEVRDTAERQHIIHALEQCNGQIGKAARLLNISRTTLWGKMQRLEIHRDGGSKGTGSGSR